MTVPSITDDLIAELEKEARETFGGVSGKWFNAEDFADYFVDARYLALLDPGTILALITRLRAAEKDAERYRWMRRNHVGASFDWDDNGMCVLAIQVPDDLAITRDLDKTIDAAIKKEQQA